MLFSSTIEIAHESYKIKNFVDHSTETQKQMFSISACIGEFKISCIQLTNTSAASLLVVLNAFGVCIFCFMFHVCVCFVWGVLLLLFMFSL